MHHAHGKANSRATLSRSSFWFGFGENAYREDRIYGPQGFLVHWKLTTKKRTIITLQSYRYNALKVTTPRLYIHDRGVCFTHALISLKGVRGGTHNLGLITILLIDTLFCGVIEHELCIWEESPRKALKYLSVFSPARTHQTKPIHPH